MCGDHCILWSPSEQPHLPGLGMTLAWDGKFLLGPSNSQDAWQKDDERMVQEHNKQRERERERRSGEKQREEVKSMWPR